MSKAVTVFLLDTFSDETALQLALSHAANAFCDKILQARKTDFVSAYVTYFGDAAKVANLELDDDSRVRMCSKIVDVVSPPSVHDLGQLMRVFADPECTGDTDVPRVLIALSKCITDVISYCGTKKFVKTVNFYTSMTSRHDAASFDDADNLAQVGALLEQNDVAVNIYQTSVTPAVSIEAQYEAWSASFPNNVRLVSYSAFKAMLTRPSVKDVKPVRTFAGDLRIGASVGHIVGQTQHNDGNDEFVAVAVDGYPATGLPRKESRTMFRSDILSASSDQVADLDRFLVQRLTEYYVKRLRAPEKVAEIVAELRRAHELKQSTKPFDEETATEFSMYENVPVDEKDVVKGYKYTDKIVPLSQVLNTEIYAANPGLDFRGIMKLQKLPPWYAMPSSMYLVPQKAGSSANEQLFAAVAEALIKLQSCMVCRFVKKSEVQMAALIGKRVADPRSKKRAASAAAAEAETETETETDVGAPGFKYYFILCPLPFKEDVRMSYFTNLDKLTLRSGEQITEHPYFLPTQEMKDKMEEYVLAMDMNKTEPRHNPGMNEKNMLLKHFMKKSAQLGVSTLEYARTFKGNDFDETEKRYLENLESFDIGEPFVLSELRSLLKVEKVETHKKAEENDDELEYLGDMGEELDLDELLGF